jgi:mRNA interferase RelE/StbE
VPSYTVIAHRRVLKFLKDLKDEQLKGRIKDVVEKLGDYPLSLRELDVDKLEGIERTFRVRIGNFRLVFNVDKKERITFITHLGKRESVYEG